MAAFSSPASHAALHFLLALSTSTVNASTGHVLWFCWQYILMHLILICYSIIDNVDLVVRYILTNSSVSHPRHIFGHYVPNDKDYLGENLVLSRSEILGAALFFISFWFTNLKSIYHLLLWNSTIKPYN